MEGSSLGHHSISGPERLHQYRVYSTGQNIGSVSFHYSKGLKLFLNAAKSYLTKNNRSEVIPGGKEHEHPPNPYQLGPSSWCLIRRIKQREHAINSNAMMGRE